MMCEKSPKRVIRDEDGEAVWDEEANFCTRCDRVRFSANWPLCSACTKEVILSLDVAIRVHTPEGEVSQEVIRTSYPDLYEKVMDRERYVSALPSYATPMPKCPLYSKWKRASRCTGRAGGGPGGSCGGRKGASR